MPSERAVAAVHLPTQKTRPDALSPAGLLHLGGSGAVRRPRRRSAQLLRKGESKGRPQQHEDAVDNVRMTVDRCSGPTDVGLGCDVVRRRSRPSGPRPQACGGMPDCSSITRCHHAGQSSDARVSMPLNP